MKAQSNIHQRDHEGLHFLAMSMGALALITILLYVRALVTGGFLDVSLDSSRFAQVLTALLILGAVALVFGWRWERLGGLLAFILGIPIAVYIATAVAEYNFFIAFIYASPLLIGGALYLLDARTRPSVR